MWFVIFIALAVAILSALFPVVITEKKISEERVQRTGYYDKDVLVQGLADRRGMDATYRATEYRIPESESREEREMIETALIRACRSVSTLAHVNNCIGWDQASTVWLFVGAAGATASLDPSWTQATDPLFSCASFNNGEYGRFLLQNALPASAVTAKGYTYDFTAMNDVHVDPCGYADIVGR